MTLDYRYVALPDVWPGKQRPAGFARKRSPFKIRWTNTEHMLAQEIKHLGGKDVTLAVDVRNPGHFRADGMLRADARPTTPAVIISFTNGDGVRLQFPCDTFGFWQDNVHAIALALESLRRVDRYGVTQGDAQYVGFKALPSGGAPALPSGGAPALPAKMSASDAAELIAKHCSFPARLIWEEESVTTVAVQTAQSRTHPDKGGESEDFQRVQEAADVLTAHHEARKANA